ncbi:calcium-binding protein [Streptomyces sp. NTH33]|uniref:EF-hand domain-containing protein n=1 Tax=Streptomyces sp. NTH33 TaxID=1735453 RepID=UPI000DA9F782|nr:EF-hand domain-containing protein [Streptomyces sp. NTH33]PZH13354.1 calcium-binding protein [Streptomyces sp. NTH33]
MATATLDPIAVKLDAMFNATDSDGDGYVDWSDYQRIIDRYLSAYNISREDRRAQALTAMYQMYWMELLRHADGTGRLDKEQYHHANRAASVDISRFNMVEGLSHAIFDVMDIDGGNTISKDEFQRYLKVWDITSPDAVEAFHEMDLDGDGTISRHEFIRAVREFFYSPNLNSPGSLLFGHLGR